MDDGRRELPIFPIECIDSSYLLCKEKDGSTIVVWYESEADIAEKTELCALLGIKNVYVLK